jgi:hypothetical protein
MVEIGYGHPLTSGIPSASGTKSMDMWMKPVERETELRLDLGPARSREGAWLKGKAVACHAGGLAESVETLLNLSRSHEGGSQPVEAVGERNLVTVVPGLGREQGPGELHRTATGVDGGGVVARVLDGVRAHVDGID